MRQNMLQLEKTSEYLKIQERLRSENLTEYYLPKGIFLYVFVYPLQTHDVVSTPIRRRTTSYDVVSMLKQHRVSTGLKDVTQTNKMKGIIEFDQTL